MKRLYMHIIFLLLALSLVNCKNKRKIFESSDSSSFSSESSDSTEELDSSGEIDSEFVSSIVKEKKLDFQGDFVKKFVFQASSLDPSVSLVCSPFSALLPLGKLALGADDATLKELLKAIGVSSKPEINKRFKGYLHDFENLQGLTLSVASRIYLNKDLKLQEKFKQETKEVFKHTVELIDSNDPSAAVDAVNSWVNKQTHGNISKILYKDDIKPNMALLLVNAVHFKGEWKFPFTRIHQSTFHGSKEDREVTMMHVTNTFNYGDSATLDAKVIEIPYKGSDAVFMIVLPKSRTGLSLLLNELRLAPTLLNKVKMNLTMVKVSMPKFTIESELDLAALYRKTGLYEIFSDSSGLQKMVKNRTLKVDMAKQKAIIEVTPEGTEAAAASVAAAVLLSSKPRGIVFEANHPFLYFIVAKRQQLFAGIFTGG